MDIGSGKARVRVGKQKLAAYLGAPKYTHGAIDAINEIGLANGLAWTSFGGETLQIEVQIVPGSGQVILTGKLGDVMQESAKAALTFIKAHAEAMLSALSDIPARADTAMTGEITLRGRVLEIGGLREKLLAAYRAGIKRVLIPRANEKDLSDVPDEVKANMEIIGVASAFDVIPLALEHTPQKTADAFIPQHAHSGAAAAQ